jgi:hypothetical protein
MLKKIKSFFKKKESNLKALESTREKIHARLPKKSFSKKLYSFERFDKEIAFIKIGKELIQISGVRKKKSVLLDFELLTKISSKYDLSKATMIHTHPNNSNSQIFLINPSDLIAFSKLNKNFNIKNFEISLINKDAEEHRRVFLKFTDKTINWIKKTPLEYVIDEINMADRLHFNRFSAGYMSSFLKQKGIIIREVPVNIK